MPGIKELAVGRSDVFYVKFEDVHVRTGWNCRDNTTEDYKRGIAALAAQIVGAGMIKQPLAASTIDGELVITDGHRRLDAMDFLLQNDPTAKIDWRIPVRMEPPKATEADRIISQIIRNSGVPFTALEQAAVIARLLDEGLSVTEIAAKTGFTDTRVRQLNDMNTLPEEMKATIRAGDVSPTTAHNIARKAASPEEASATLAEAVKLAKGSGKKKASPRHVKLADAVREPKKTPAEVKAAAKAIADALEKDVGPKTNFATREQRDAAFAAIREIFTPSFDLSITDNADGSVTIDAKTSHEKISAIRTYFGIPEGSNVEGFI